MPIVASALFSRTRPKRSRGDHGESMLARCCWNSEPLGAPDLPWQSSFTMPRKFFRQLAVEAICAATPLRHPECPRQDRPVQQLVRGRQANFPDRAIRGDKRTNKWDRDCAQRMLARDRRVPASQSQAAHSHIVEKPFSSFSVCTNSYYWTPSRLRG